MAKPITGKTHVGERSENRPNGDIYIYERITAYNEKTSNQTSRRVNSGMGSASASTIFCQII
jgi:hypothetical protein